MKKVIVSLLVSVCIFLSGFAPAKAETVDNSILLQKIAELEKQISLLQQMLALTQQINELRIAKVSEKIVEVEDIAPVVAIAGIEDNYKLEACEERDQIYLNQENGYNRLVKMANISGFDFSSLCSDKTIPCLLSKYEKLEDYCKLHKDNCAINYWTFESTRMGIEGYIDGKRTQQSIYNQWDIADRKCKYGQNWEN